MSQDKRDLRFYFNGTKKKNHKERDREGNGPGIYRRQGLGRERTNRVSDGRMLVTLHVNRDFVYVYYSLSSIFVICLVYCKVRPKLGFMGHKTSFLRVFGASVLS